MKKLYTQYADRGFQIVSISIDKKEAEWTKALKERTTSVGLNFFGILKGNC